jgi:hypothetical protein
MSGDRQAHESQNSFTYRETCTFHAGTIRHRRRQGRKRNSALASNTVSQRPSVVLYEHPNTDWRWCPDFGDPQAASRTVSRHQHHPNHCQKLTIVSSNTKYEYVKQNSSGDRRTSGKSTGFWRLNSPLRQARGESTTGDLLRRHPTQLLRRRANFLDILPSPFPPWVSDDLPVRL